MKPMLDGEYRRYKIGVWCLDKILISIPIGLFCVCITKTVDVDFVLLAVAISLQNYAIYRITRRMK